MPSFDIVCKVDLQELDNALNQAKKEIANRYDLKTANTKIEFKEKQISISSSNDYTLKASVDVLTSKMIRRGISLKVLELGPVEPSLSGEAKQVIKLQEGIPQEKAKQVVKSIKGTKLKVQAQIQGDQLRVIAKKIDDLQSVISLLKANDHGIYMDFVNMKS